MVWPRLVWLCLVLWLLCSICTIQYVLDMWVKNLIRYLMSEWKIWLSIVLQSTLLTVCIKHYIATFSQKLQWLLRICDQDQLCCVITELNDCKTKFSQNKEKWTPMNFVQTFRHQLSLCTPVLYVCCWTFMWSSSCTCCHSAILAILGRVFTTWSGVIAWERGHQLAFLVVIMLPSLHAFFRFQKLNLDQWIAIASYLKCKNGYFWPIMYLLCSTSLTNITNNGIWSPRL